VKGRSDAVCCELSIRISERNIRIKTDIRTWHDLSLEGVSMNVYRTGQGKEPGCVQHPAHRASGRVQTDSSPGACALHTNVAALETACEQNVAALDNQHAEPRNYLLALRNEWI